MIEIIGKNGSGKTTISNLLAERKYDKCIGYTTRKPRKKEIDGRDYHFITKEEFLDKIEKGLFVDYKERNGDYYGILLKDVHENSILVSGDAKQIEEKTKIPVIRLYIDADFPIRLKRVKERKESISDLYDRFHGENFSFLTDFDAIFVNNNEYNNQSIEKIISLLVKTQREIQDCLISNQTFLKGKMEAFQLKELKKRKNKLERLLQYEEFLMRRLFIEGKTTEEEYRKNMITFLENNQIMYGFDESGLFARDEKNKILLNYKNRK